MTRTDVRAALTEQVDAWNRGDLDAFCADFTEDVTYVNAAGVHLGREEVVAAYREAYPDPAAMGTLSLRVVRIEEGGELAIAVVEWSLAPLEGETREGHAMLAFRQTDGSWRLTCDATLGGAR